MTIVWSGDCATTQNKLQTAQLFSPLTARQVSREYNQDEATREICETIRILLSNTMHEYIITVSFPASWSQTTLSMRYSGRRGKPSRKVKVVLHVVALSALMAAKPTQRNQVGETLRHA
jgi:hypothetical protein